jgi:hypothetical protein
MMKLLSMLAAGVALYGGAHVFNDSQGRANAIQAPSRAGLYQLVANGDESCVVRRGESLSSGLFAVRFDAACSSLLPDIARATRWRESEDGTVTFSTPTGEKVVAFAAADGEGYLSYAPATPLLSLAGK